MTDTHCGFILKKITVASADEFDIQCTNKKIL